MTNDYYYYFTKKLGKNLKTTNHMKRQNYYKIWVCKQQTNTFVYIKLKTEIKMKHKTNKYSEICLTQTLDKPEPCINQTFNKVPMLEIFVNLTCIN